MEISFNEENIKPVTHSPSKTGLVTKLVIQSGLAKDTRSANLVMIMFVILMLSIVTVIYFSQKDQQNLPDPLPEEPVLSKIHKDYV